MQWVATLVMGLSLVASAAVETPERILDLSKAQSKVEFLAIGKPSMLKIRGIAKPEGDAKALEGTLTFKGDSVSGTAKVALDTIDTGISLRNRHMKEKYLETAKFPKAEFTFTEFKLPEAVQKGDGTAKDVPFKGTLTIHGVAKEVAGKANIVRTADKTQLEFAFGTKIPDHKIELPGFMGVKVAEDVEVSVNVEGPLVKPEGPMS